jgi:hypothetical protein
VVASVFLARQAGPGQPPVIAAAVASYQSGRLDGSATTPAPPPVRQAGDLVWRGARRGRLACADRPAPSLLVARDPAQALQAASRLGLH